ncbi:MAG: magnesium-transporting ATPase [Cyanobacteria bacterium M5B4]|nr:MAG: magnesium-transporting ATPase [Cyanobacteria bacterium M5B4]
MTAGEFQNSSSRPMPEKLWFNLPASEVLAYWETNPDRGLNHRVVKERLEQYGANELPAGEVRSAWRIFYDQFTNVMLLLLMAVAAISAGLDIYQREFPKDAVAIMVIVLLNGILGYAQESKAEQALQALKQLSAPLVRVVRHGIIQEVKSPELVPGDIMLLEAGVQIAADGRLIETVNLQVRESALTGESQAINKDGNLVLAPDTLLADRLNMVYQGTEVVQGRGTAVVVATGQTTVLGQIAQSLGAVQREDTPLQRRMEQLSQALVMGSLILVAVVVTIGVISSGVFLIPDLTWGTFWQQSRLEQLLNTSLSMAVAVVPEGLPAVVTVTLALGTQRMVKRNALIRKLPAVETLGSVTVICTDKTGTLTQNKMVVETIVTPQTELTVTGDGYSPTGNFLYQGEPITEFDPNLTRLLQACALCNDALLQFDQGWKILGDPTEGALLTLSAKAGIDPDRLKLELPRRGEIPFTSERKRMSVLCPPYAFTKGSVESVLDCCQFFDQRELTIADRDTILHRTELLARQGMRVLGFAYARQEKLQEEGLIWLGLVAMRDAPRAEAKAAVALCYQAGIRPIMITGDHPATAQAIGLDLGIISTAQPPITGKDLVTASPTDLRTIVQHNQIFARVSPDHKLAIVQALQQNGEFVAMTGDGVNDAPALKQANIGISMGITGTDVAKEASDMILRDDNFATILAATEEGRVVYANIRRFIKYILGSNVGEVLTIGMAPLLGLPEVPLTPLQILWMNLVTDGLPALALAVEPGEADIMKQLPISPQESIFARGLGSYILRIGLIFGLLTIGLMLWTFATPSAHWRTIVFTTLCLAQMGHALSCRSDRYLLIELPQFTNPFLLGAVVLTTLLQILLLYVPLLRQFFGTEQLTLTELTLCFGASTLIFAAIEVDKLIRRGLRSGTA